MNPLEISLLLYLESRLVEHGGTVVFKKIRQEERRILQKWIDDGFIFFGDIKPEDIRNFDGFQVDKWVLFSPQAWRVARRERFRRAMRLEQRLKVERIGVREDMRFTGGLG